MTDFTPGFTYSSQLDRPAMRGLSRNNNIYTIRLGGGDLLRRLLLQLDLPRRPRRHADRPGRNPLGSAGHPLRPQRHRRPDQHPLQAADRHLVGRDARGRSATTATTRSRARFPARSPTTWLSASSFYDDNQNTRLVQQPRARHALGRRRPPRSLCRLPVRVQDRQGRPVARRLRHHLQQRPRRPGRPGLPVAGHTTQLDDLRLADLRPDFAYGPTAARLHPASALRLRTSPLCGPLGPVPGSVVGKIVSQQPGADQHPQLRPSRSRPTSMSAAPMRRPPLHPPLRRRAT